MQPPVISTVHACLQVYSAQMPFTSLPVEVKQAIWKLALPEDKSEVCIIWPLNQIGFDQVALPLVVDTCFPVLMHVCSEWRGFVLESSLSRIRFRASHQAGCQTPYRPFRGDMDILYACATNFEKAVQCLGIDYEPGVGLAVLKQVRHLAVDWNLWKRAAFWLPELVFRGSPDLEKVSVVFPSSRKGMWMSFQAPARRCRLQRVENPDDLKSEREARPEEMVSVQWQVDYGREHAEDEAPFTWQNEMDCHEMDFNEHRTDWFKGSAWNKEVEAFCLEYEAVAFVQYQRLEEGSENWAEACEERLLDRGQDGRWQEPPIPDQRRDPEEWRVNDDDDYIY